MINQSKTSHFNLKFFIDLFKTFSTIVDYKTKLIDLKASDVTRSIRLNLFYQFKKKGNEKITG